MSAWGKTILIIDESGFSRVCFAILEFEGYGVETITNCGDLATRLDNNEFGLIITSYPYGAFLFEDIKKREIPTIILSDHINSDLIETLESFDNSYCMIKPLDYQKFTSLVRQVIKGEANIQGGYTIV